MDTDRTLMRAPAPEVQTTTISRPRGSWFSRVIPTEFWSKTALLWATTQFLIVGIVQAIILKMHRDTVNDIQSCVDLYKCYTDSLIPENARAITIYHGLMILAQGFQMVLAFDAVLNKSMMQLLSTIVFNFALLGYSVIQYFQAERVLNGTDLTITLLKIKGFVVHRTSIYEIIVIGLMGLYCLGWVYISVRLYKVFGWQIFKELGADIAVRRRLTLYYVYMMLLKLDVFFFLGFIGQYFLLVLNQSDDNVKLLWVNAGIAFPITAVLLVIAYFAIRRESNVLMTILLLGLSGVMGYLITRLVDIYTSPARYASSKNSLTFFEIITILICLATFVVAILNFRNFGQGLIDQLKQRGSTKAHFQLDDLGGGSRVAAGFRGLGDEESKPKRWGPGQ